VTWRGLLVSVRDEVEAAAAVAGGAAIIDVKEPRRGPLGAADAETAAAVAAAVGQVPWTMACGELADAERTARECGGTLLAALEAALDGRAPPPAAVKVGLAATATTQWWRRLADLLAPLPPGMERVAVAYADWERAGAPPPTDVIAAAHAIGCGTLLVDTFDKAAAGLFGCCGAHTATAWVRAARAAGLRVAVAGRIALGEIPAAWALGPDVVAVRSAVCFNGRDGTVRADLVRRAVAIGPARASATAAPWERTPSAGVGT
jgi:uncharacterized protein (UPF0264 family)